MIRRQRTVAAHASELEWMLSGQPGAEPAHDELFRPDDLQDDLLRMMFACCDPRLPERTQVALMLQILCGFSIGEISAAFMSGHAAMEKRLTRAKKVLATSRRLFDLASPGLATRRLPAVQRALYLLFNEGYHGASAEAPIRAELCREAMRLAALLLKDARCATPATYALGALMCLHAARLPARVDGAGDLVALGDQDRQRWNRELVVEGMALLERAATGPDLSAFHLEAAIAAAHVNAADVGATDWGAIVALYDLLMTVQPSPTVALNRAVAVAQHAGPSRGLAELRAIQGLDRLSDYPFYFAALGELEAASGHAALASAQFREALVRARSPAEQRHYARRLEACWTLSGAPRSFDLMWADALQAYATFADGGPAPT
jgi:RNA polymerase sigma-70 factor (ECF subfamily)